MAKEKWIGVTAGALVSLALGLRACRCRSAGSKTGDGDIVWLTRTLRTRQIHLAAKVIARSHAVPARKPS